MWLLRFYAIMKDIVTNGIYDYTIFTTNGKYNKAIWTRSHVVMANCICGLGLEHQSLM